MSVYYRYKLQDDEASTSGFARRRHAETKEDILDSRDDPLASHSNMPMDDPNLPVNQPHTTTSAPPTATSQFVDPFGPTLPSPTAPNAASKVPVVGGILGGIVALVLVASIVFFLHSRTRRQRTEYQAREKETTLPLEKVVLPNMPDVVARPFKVVLPNMPDVVARPFTPDRVPSIIIPPGLRINTDTPLTSKHSPLPSSTYSPARSKGYTQSPSTVSSTRPSPLTQQPEAPTSSFLDFSQTPATPSALSTSHEHLQTDAPPVPPKPSRREMAEHVSNGSTRPLYIQPKQKVRKVKSAPHRFSRVLHICHRNNEGGSRSRTEDTVPPPAYTEPEWSFWDGESPRRSRFTQ